METITTTLKKSIMKGDKEVKTLTLRKPASGELRGIKMLDILQMDAQAHAVLVPRICEEINSPTEFWSLDSADLVAVMGDVLSFFVGTSIDIPTT